MILAGIGGGTAACLELNRRAANLEAAYRLIGWMASRLRYTAAPIQEIAEAAAAEPAFSRLSFLEKAAEAMRLGESPAQAWDNAVAADDAGGFRQADKALLRGFGRGLGCSDLQGQLSHCEAFAAQLDDSARSARVEAAAKGKLYVTLGAAGGLCAALLLL